MSATGKSTESQDFNSRTNGGGSFNSKNDPWANSIPALDNILSQVNNLDGSVSGSQSAALAAMKNAAAGMRDFSPEATAVGNEFLTGGSAYPKYEAGLSPYLNANYLDPMSNPAMSGLLSKISNDVGASINGQFAGAGRDLSPANTRSTSEGLARGLAEPLFNQYNANVGVQRGAQDSLYGAGQDALANKARALGLFDMANNFKMAPAQAQMAAADAEKGKQFQNLGLMSSLAVPIAGLGGTESGNNTSFSDIVGRSFKQGTKTDSPLDQALKWSKLFNDNKAFGGDAMKAIAGMFA